MTSLKERRNSRKERNEIDRGLSDIRDEFSIKQIILFAVVDLLVSTFIAGLIAQMFRTAFGLQESVGILSCFKYGIISLIGLPLTVFFFILSAYTAFRMKMAARKDYQTDREKNKETSDKGTYGTGGYQSEPERKKCFDRAETPDDFDNNPYILGRGAEDGMLYALKDNLPSINAHMVVFGSSGAGKSAALVKGMIYQGLKRGKSLIVTDSKGDLYADTAALAKKYGYDVKMLNLKSTELKNSDGCDMLKTLHDDDVKAGVLADTIIRNTEGDPKLDYWAKNERNMLKAFLLYVTNNDAYIKAGKNNLAEVYNLITSKSLDEINEMFGILDDDHPAKSPYKIFSQAKPDVQGQIINGLGIRLDVLSNKWAKRVVSADEIDLLAPMKHKCLYYVVISDMDETFKFIASLFFSLLFIEMCDFYDRTSQKCRKAGKKVNLLPVDFILDEYANTGAINGMNQKISTVRSRKIGITIILQDKGQLEEMYSPRVANTILNNIPVKMLLKTTDLVTATYFSDLMGVETVRVTNKSYTERSSQIFHLKDEYKVSEGLGKRQVENPDELINSLDANQLIVLVSGFHPVKLNKYFHFEHPMDKECEPLVPSEHVPKWRREMLKKESVKKGSSKDTDAVNDDESGEKPDDTKPDRTSHGNRPVHKPVNFASKSTNKPSGDDRSARTDAPVVKRHDFDDESLFPED